LPIYEYRCADCGGISEIWHGVGTRSDSLQCKHCGGRRVEKILSASRALLNPRPKGATCCGREERCDKPPCSSDGPCRRD
jgi:putative FmdB family regulatory protein